MLRWDRARPGVTYRCGKCGELVPTGKPLLVVTITKAGGGTLPTRYRCDRPGCAGPAPPDLPALPVLTEYQPTREPISIAGLLPLDWRPVVEQLRSREPGEDDE